MYFNPTLLSITLSVYWNITAMNPFKWAASNFLYRVSNQQKSVSSSGNSSVLLLSVPQYHAQSAITIMQQHCVHLILLLLFFFGAFGVILGNNEKKEHHLHICGCACVNPFICFSSMMELLNRVILEF